MKIDPVPCIWMLICQPSIILTLKCAVWVPLSNEEYAPTHSIFPSFKEIDKTAGAYSL